MMFADVHNGLLSLYCVYILYRFSKDSLLFAALLWRPQILNDFHEILIVSQNLTKFIAYQTFLHGFN